MAHSEFALDFAASFAKSKRFSAQLPDYVPEWEQQSSTRLEHEKTTRLKAMFREWDADGSGTISRSELKAVLSHISPSSEKDIDEMMHEADKDQNGIIDLEEFLSWLYDETSSGHFMFDYGNAFFALFQAYDKGKTGTISYKEFEECHAILKGSLTMNPVTDQEDHPIDSLGLDEEAELAFSHANGSNVHAITFVEFVQYMSKMIDPKSTKQEEFCEVAFKLAGALKTLFKGIRRAEKGKIREDQPEVLEAMISDLAETAREFHDTLTKKAPEKKPQQWIDPPRGLKIEQLKAAHMKHMPVNVLMVESFVFDVVVVPQAPAGKEETNERIWLGEVRRELRYKSGVVRREFPCFYLYDDNDKEWRLLPEASESFTTALKSLDPEMGLFCLMKLEADYGTELSWGGVKSALNAGRVMGWISDVNVTEYYKHMEEKALTMLQKKALDGSVPENPQTAASNFLEVNLIQRPRAVMATLSHLGIVDVNPTWIAFITSD